MQLDKLNAERRRLAGTALSIGVVTAIALASILPASQATLWPDTVRDLSSSLGLARGESFPLVGPPINFGPHMGPIFIWVQALLLAFMPSLAAASVFLAAIASLKFYFLYAFGRVLKDGRLGLCFAVAAAYPSVAVYNWIVFFHPNWVEAGITASMLLAAIAWKKRSIVVFYAAAATLGLAVQLHPTALFYFPATFLLLYWMKVRGWKLLIHFAGGVAMITFWFSPMLFVPGRPASAGLDVGVSRIGTGLSAFSASDVLTVIKTAYFDIPLAVGDTYAAQVGVSPTLWSALLVIFAIGCLWGFVLAARDRGALLILGVLLVLLIFGWVCATAVRTYTSFWQCFFLLPLSAVSLGALLDRALTSGPVPSRLLGLGAVTCVFVAFTAAAVGARTVGEHAALTSRLPVIADLRHPLKGTVEATLVTAASRDKLARHVCKQPGTVHLYGDFAFALAASTALDFRVHCPKRADDVLLLGPPGDAYAITGVSASKAIALRKEPLAAFDGLAAYKVLRVVHPPTARAIERDWHHFEQLRDRQPITLVTLDFVADPREVVQVYRLKPFDSLWRKYTVTRDGEIATPTFSTYNSEVFLHRGASPIKWRIQFETDGPQWIDVHIF